MPRLTVQIRSGPALVPALRQQKHIAHTCAGAGVGDAGEEAGEVAEEVARGLLRAQLERHAGRLHDDPLRQGGLRPCTAAWGPHVRRLRLAPATLRAGPQRRLVSGAMWHGAVDCQLLRRRHPAQSL